MLSVKTFLFTTLLCGAMALTACQTLAPTNEKPTLQQQVNQTVIVMFGPTVNQAPLQQLIQRYHGNITQKYTTLNGIAVLFPQGTNMATVMAELRQVDGVKSVEMDNIQTI